MVRKFTTSKNRLLLGCLSVLFFFSTLLLFKASVCTGILMLLVTSLLVTFLLVWKMEYTFYDDRFAAVRPSISHNEFTYDQIYDVFAVYSVSEHTENAITLKPGYAIFLRILPDYAVFRLQLDSNQKLLCQEMLDEFKTRIGADKVRDIRTTIEESTAVMSDQKDSAKKRKRK